VRLPEGEGALFGATPFFLAAYAGNAAALRDLFNAGGGRDDKMGSSTVTGAERRQE
jgi:hypothetical protein